MGLTQWECSPGREALPEGRQTGSNLFLTGLGSYLAMWQEGDATAAAQLCPGGP